jgi:ArsR family transcriptional regulator, arsenate/arsenite/antimonite-responsive transcriptional repressor
MTVDMFTDSSIDVNMFLMDITPIDFGCCVIGKPMTDAGAEQLATQLKALADPVRLKLISLLTAAATGEICACDLPAALGKSQPTVSHHLSVLVGTGLLHREQRGKWAWFTLNAPLLASIREALGPPASQRDPAPLNR